MTRTTAREIAVQLGFALCAKQQKPQEILDTFFDTDYYCTLAEENELFAQYPNEKQLQYIRTLATGVAEKKEELDGYISKYSKKWKLNRISRTAVAIMRTAMYEVLYLPDVPDSVAVNEAVELAKKYETPETVTFINGLLGSFVREQANATAEPATEAPVEESAAVEPETAEMPMEESAPAAPEQTSLF
ncbi:MAG: transcription antitermination factor NusB [Oscillospiraceae bacterium]|jgi:N utilization substance protein B